MTGVQTCALPIWGHIFGKDSVYAAGLFVEMCAAIKKPIKEFWQELSERYGKYIMCEENLKFTENEKITVQRILIKEKRVPDFAVGNPTKINYTDGVKFYFKDAFVICRFSGTEPLLRIFAEGKTEADALRLIREVKDFIS